MAPREFTPQELKYWGVIRGAAADKLTTAQLWDRIKAYEAASGTVRPSSMFSAVPALRSLGVQARIAGEKLSKAADQAAITAEHIAPELNARPLHQQALAPKYIARFKVTVVTAAGEAIRWLSYIFHGRLPTTVGQLRSFLTLQAPGLGLGSEELVTGITGDVQLVAQ